MNKGLAAAKQEFKTLRQESQQAIKYLRRNFKDKKELDKMKQQVIMQP